MAKKDKKSKEDQAALQKEADQSTAPPPPPKSEVQKSCNDILFAILFLLCLAFTFALAIMYGNEVLSNTEDVQDIKEAANYVKAQRAKYKYAARICAAIAGGTLVGSLIWTVIMLLCGRLLIWLSVIGVCTISLVSGFASTKFLYNQPDRTPYYWCPAALGSLFAILVMLYVCCIRNRIAFASANLQVACKAALSYPVVLGVAVWFTCLQVVWALVWIIATYAAINHGEYITEEFEEGDGYSKTKKFGILVGMLLIFFWGSTILRNIIMVTTAGTVCSWWNHNSQERRPLTTTRALCRALTLSFGSICFGSLIVSIVQTIRAVLAMIQSMFKRSGNRCAACMVGCLGCMVACLQKWIEYFNRYAYSYVGIYGYSFISSGKRAWQLFQSKGLSAITNDSLISNVLMFGKIVVGFAGCAAGIGTVVYGKAQWTAKVRYPEAALGISGFLIGYTVADVIMTVIDGAVASVFLLFAENPQILQHSHPSSHEKLVKTWQEIYPNEYEMACKHHDDASGSV